MPLPYTIDFNVVRERLKEGRKLSGYLQIDAAKELGFANSGALSKIEDTQDIYNREITTTFLYNASRIYGVSLDFLMGLTASPDVDYQQGMERALYRGMQHHIANNAKLVTNQLVTVAKTSLPYLTSLKEVIEYIELLDQKYKRFKELNPEAEDEFRGMSPLEAIINKLSAFARTNRVAFSREDKAKKLEKMLSDEGHEYNLIEEMLSEGIGDEIIHMHKENQLSMWKGI